MSLENQSLCRRRSHESSVAKKKNLVGLVIKRLFAAKPKTNDGKKSRGWKWFSGGDKSKQYSSTSLPKTTINGARKDQKKQAVAVATAMAAAAKAAVAAAHAAIEVVHLTAVPQSVQEFEERTRNLAAIKIQAAYRTHLAKKALKALKGLVRLQALVRGRLARQQIFSKLSRLRRSPSAIMTHRHFFQESQEPSNYGSCNNYGKKQVYTFKDELEEDQKKLRCHSLKNWDQNLISKEDMETLWLRKQEASLQRERMKKYSYSYRETRNDCALETLEKKKEMSTSESSFRSNVVSKATYGGIQLKLKNTPKHDLLEDINFPLNLPRRSFCDAKQNSFREGNPLSKFPDFATYMASTESAKAKIRSMSTRRQSLGIFDTCFDYNSMCKARISTSSAFDGVFGSSSGRTNVPEQISSRMLITERQITNRIIFLCNLISFCLVSTL